MNETQIPRRDTLMNAITPQELINKLRSAIGTQGDFPASAKVVTELKRLAANPNTPTYQLTEVILREPSLGPRILHLVNSAFYNRNGNHILTVSQAVIRMGMKQIADLCAGLVLLQRFVPLARKDSAFAQGLRRTIVTSLLSAAFASADKDADNNANESGFLAGSFAELGVLLLSYYFPQLWSQAVKRAEQKRITPSQSLTEITGLSPLQLSQAIIESLNLPTFYMDIVTVASGHKLPPERQNPAIERLAKDVSTATMISEAVVSAKSRSSIDAAIKTTLLETDFTVDQLRIMLADLREAFKDHCQILEANLPSLPDFLTEYKQSESFSVADDAPVKAESPPLDSFSRFVIEIKQAVESREPTASVVTTVMESLAYGMQFERVLLLLANKQRTALSGRMLLGEKCSIDPKSINRVFSAISPRAVDLKAIREGRPIFSGEPVLPSGNPFVAIPVGRGTKCIGVVYADKVAKGHAPFDIKEIAAFSVLTDLLERSVGATSI